MNDTLHVHVMAGAEGVTTQLDTSNMHNSTTGYMGWERVDPSSKGCIWSCEELVGKDSLHKMMILEVDVNNLYIHHFIILLIILTILII